MSDQKEENLEWNNIKDGKPEAGRRVHLKLYAEYFGSWEPEEGQDGKGQWIMDKPEVNTSLWKYVNVKDEESEMLEDI